MTPRPQEVGELYPVRAGALRLATRTVNLGYVPRGSIKAKTIEYYNDTERPLNMTVVYPKAKPYLDVALSATRIEPKQKGVLTVTYDLRDCDVGSSSGAFSLMVNDEFADTEFSATGNRYGRFLIADGRVGAGSESGFFCPSITISAIRRRPENCAATLR